MDRPPRMLRGMTRIAFSTTRSARGGRSMCATTRLMMRGEMIQRGPRVGEELAKETEGDHRIRHLEEEEISLVHHPDRRVSLMVLRVTLLLKYYPR